MVFRVLAIRSTSISWHHTPSIKLAQLILKDLEVPTAQLVGTSASGLLLIGTSSKILQQGRTRRRRLANLRSYNSKNTSAWLIIYKRMY